MEVNNEEIFKKAKEYFEETEDIIPFNENDEIPKMEGNIYGLYVDKKLMYIGERQNGKIHERLKQHFRGCSESTKSKHKEISEEVNNKKKVGYKTLLIEPDYERYSLETYLIINIKDLPWNCRDKGSKKKVAELSSTDDIEVELSENEDE